MDRHILTHDPVTQHSEVFYFDHDTGLATIRDEQDVSGILDANKIDYNEAPARHGDALGKKVASIPLGLFMDLRKQGITRDRKAFARWLNDPDNRLFRTAPGMV